MPTATQTATRVGQYKLRLKTLMHVIFYGTIIKPDIVLKGRRMLLCGTEKLLLETASTDVVVAVVFVHEGPGGRKVVDLSGSLLSRRAER